MATGLGAVAELHPPTQLQSDIPVGRTPPPVQILTTSGLPSEKQAVPTEVFGSSLMLSETPVIQPIRLAIGNPDLGPNTTPIGSERNRVLQDSIPPSSSTNYMTVGLVAVAGLAYFLTRPKKAFTY